MTNLFDDLKLEGETAIDRWIFESLSENLLLDCKLKENSGKASLDGNDKKHLANTISAFANSEGGLLIWGVDARTKNGVDCLVAKQPINDIVAFRSAVEHALAELISPPIIGIEFLALRAGTPADSGFLAIRVPASERRPHMSKSKGERAFYFRNGHQSLQMEVFQVRDQMLRRSVPTLEFSWDVQVRYAEISDVHVEAGKIPISIDLNLRNISDVSARFPYLIIRTDRARYLSMGPLYHDFAQQGLPIEANVPFEVREIRVDYRSISSDRELFGGADCCIHPGANLRVATITLLAPAFVQHENIAPHGKTRVLVPRYIEVPYVIAECSFGCLDTALQRVPLHLSGTEISAKLAANGQSGPIQIPSY